MKHDDRKEQGKAPDAGLTAKVVADMPEDEKMRERLEEHKQNDGFPGSCGGV
ncbi:hypothetical protein [Paenibacillus sp. GYB003]|uniref:hypothetical protein n=1 Tax=Paenibacillus sp. GYB003 TaxID=2994392 RepID=UPI002F96DBD9